MLKVIVEHKILKGKEFEYAELSRKLQSKASHQPGYVCSERRMSRDDSRCSTITTTWVDPESCQAWESSEECRSIASTLRHLLADSDETIEFVIPPVRDIHWDAYAPLGMVLLPVE